MTDGAAGVGVGKLTKECREAERVFRSCRWFSMGGCITSAAWICGLRRFAVSNVSGETGKASQLRLGRNMAVSRSEIRALFGTVQRFVRFWSLWVFHVACE